MVRPGTTAGRITTCATYVRAAKPVPAVLRLTSLAGRTVAVGLSAGAHAALLVTSLGHPAPAGTASVDTIEIDVAPVQQVAEDTVDPFDGEACRRRCRVADAHASVSRCRRATTSSPRSEPGAHVRAAFVARSTVLA